jgi:uncharacterized membrane protein YqaE (UPF0057 family)
LDLLPIILAILLPPLGVFLQVGIGKQFWINILLQYLYALRNTGSSFTPGREI